MEKLTKSNSPGLCQSINMVFFDIDGVLLNSMGVLPKAKELVKRLKEVGKKIFFVTNYNGKVREGILKRFIDHGFIVDAEEILSSSYLAAVYMKNIAKVNMDKKVYVIGSEGIGDELDLLGVKHFGIGPRTMEEGMDAYVSCSASQEKDDVGAVLVGYDKHFSMQKVCEAMNYLSDPSIPFIATSIDNQYPIGNGKLAPGTGVVVDAIISASERKPIVVGKPNKMFLDIAQTICNIDPGKCLMVGDRLNTDIKFGRNCGFKTLCVLTGVTDYNTLQRAHNGDDVTLIPHYFADDLTELLNGLG